LAGARQRNFHKIKAAKRDIGAAEDVMERNTSLDVLLNGSIVHQFCVLLISQNPPANLGFIPELLVQQRMAGFGDLGQKPLQDFIADFFGNYEL
jgi:hypothetical protein